MTVSPTPSCAASCLTSHSLGFESTSAPCMQHIYQDTSNCLTGHHLRDTGYGQAVAAPLNFPKPVTINDATMVANVHVAGQYVVQAGGRCFISPQAVRT
jgi:hypothetical protein